VGSLEGIVVRLHAEGLRGAVGVVVDAQRREFHLATYMLGGEGPRELGPLRLVSAGGVQALLEAGTRVFGPGLASALPDASDAYPDALTVARLGASREALPDGAHLDAIHLRQPAFAKASAVSIR
jgi:hypothetical protein